MAEVSSSVSLSKSKLSSGSGLSSKHIYDDIFSSPVKLKSSSCAFVLDDYAEIFSRSTASLPSSIPVLDLPLVGERDDDLVRVRSSRVDYSGIFGDSVGQDEIALNSDEFSLRDYERVKIPAKASRSLTAQMENSKGSELHGRIDTNQMSNVSSTLSSDNVNYENVSHQGSSTVNKEGRKDTRVTAEVLDVPRLSSTFDEAAPLKKNIPVDSVKLIVDDANISMNFGKGNKPRKHSQQVTPDLASVEKPIQHNSRHERENSDSGFYVVDNSKNTFEASVEANPPNTVPTPVSPTLSEELDINSDAAVCAAALKRAIEEAEAQICLAKEMLEVSDSHGSMKMTFKDSLKFGPRNDNKHYSQADGFKENDLPETSAHVDVTVDQRPKEVEQVALDFGDQIQVPRDDEDRNITNAQEIRSTSPEGGGEWEAAKHLSQLITGVKNRLVSFMSWQTDDEKKVLQKQATIASDCLCQSQHCDRVVNDMNFTQRKESSADQEIDFKDGGGLGDTNLMASVPTVCELEANDMERNVLPQETIFRGFKIWLDPEDCMKLTDPPGSEEKAKGTDEDSFMCNYDRREQEQFDDADREIAEEVVEQNQENNNDSEMQEYELSAIDTEHSVLHRKILEHAEYMVDHDVEEATEVTANDESLNNILQNDGPDKSMVDSYGGGLNMDEEGIEKGKEHVQKVVVGHQEQSELLDESYLVQTNMKEEVPVDEHKWDENDDTERQNYQAVAEEKQNDSDAYLVEKIREGGKEDACIWEENEEIRRHNDQTLSQQNLEGTNFVTENDLMPETGVEEGTESVTIRLKNDTIGIGTDRSVVHQLENDRKVQDEGHSEGEVDEGETTEDADKLEKNAVQEVAEQPKIAVVQTVASPVEEVGELGGAEDVQTVASLVEEVGELGGAEDVQTVASLVEEVGELGGAEDAYKWEEIAEIQCSPVTDQSHDSTMQVKVTQGVNNEHQTAADHNPEQEKSVSSRGEAHQLDETSQSGFSCENTKMAESSTYPQPEVHNEESVAVKMPKKLDPEILFTSVSAEDTVYSHEIRQANATCRPLSYEGSGLQEVETDKREGLDIANGKVRGYAYCSNLISDINKLVDEFGKCRNPSGRQVVIDQEKEKCSPEATHKRRRWFEGIEKEGPIPQPNLFGGDSPTTKTAQQPVVASNLKESVEIQVEESVTKKESVEIQVEESVTKSREDIHVEEPGAATNIESDTAKTPERSKNIEATHKRRRWFENREEVRASKPSNIVEEKETSIEIDHEITRTHSFCGNSNDPVNTSAACSDGRKADPNIHQREVHNSESAHRRKRWFENREKLEPIKHPIISEDTQLNSVIDKEEEHNMSRFEQSNLGVTSGAKEDLDTNGKEDSGSGTHQDIEEVKRREKEKEKERLAVERAIREARERAYAEARERAERATLDKTTGESRERVAGPPHDRSAKASAEAKSAVDEASAEARLRAERAAVERATAEARERALRKAVAEKSSYKPKEQPGNYAAENNSASDQAHSSGPFSNSRFPSSSDSASLTDERTDLDNGESVERYKARQQRLERTKERAAKALEEKNMRDLQALKEQAERNKYADVLDEKVKRWCSGKEGNLRALLSTLQYILGPDNGWQPMSLTDLVTSTAVRKAYKRATLSVHPDKLQQRGASIQQKYICEKVFDLLKEAWQKFSPDEH